MWDQRYARPEYVYGLEPNDFVRQSLPHLSPGGRLLCLAEGEGRNAVWLAQQGFAVSGVDGSAVARDKALALAASRGVSLSYIQADLAEFALGQACWDGIISIFAHLPPALRQRVHGACVQALKPGGLLVLEAYTPRQLDYGSGGPPDPAWLMSAAGLSQELAGLTMELLEEKERTVLEGLGHTGLGHVVQLLARRPLAD